MICATASIPWVSKNVTARSAHRVESCRSPTLTTWTFVPAPSPEATNACSRATTGYCRHTRQRLTRHRQKPRARRPPVVDIPGSFFEPPRRNRAPRHPLEATAAPAQRYRDSASTRIWRCGDETSPISSSSTPFSRHRLANSLSTCQLTASSVSRSFAFPTRLTE